MNDLVILGLSLSTVVILLGVTLYALQNRQFKASHNEFKMFQMENNRILLENTKFMEQMEIDAQRNQAENRQFFRGLSHNVGQIYLKLDEEQNGKS